MVAASPGETNYIGGCITGIDPPAARTFSRGRVFSRPQRTFIGQRSSRRRRTSTGIARA